MGCSQTKPYQTGPDSCLSAGTNSTTAYQYTMNANIKGYQFIKQIGRGGVGTTYLCKNLENEFCAIQVIPKSTVGEDACSVFTSHFSQLQMIDHPYIVKFYELIEDTLNLYIVMEYCSGITLYDKVLSINKFTEHEASKIIYMILEAVDYLGSIGIVHCDIKPINIIYSDIGPLIKLIDFNLCRFKKEGYDEHIDGTPQFISPELLDYRFSCASDVWAIGVTMHVLLSGEYPFWGDDIEELYKMIKVGKVCLGTDWECVSADAKDLMYRLLTPNYKERINTKMAISHPWFSRVQRRKRSYDSEVYKMMTSIASIYEWKCAFLKYQGRYKIHQDDYDETDIIFYFLSELNHDANSEEIETILSIFRKQTSCKMESLFDNILKMENYDEEHI